MPLTRTPSAGWAPGTPLNRGWPGIATLFKNSNSARAGTSRPTGGGGRLAPTPTRNGWRLARDGFTVYPLGGRLHTAMLRATGWLNFSHARHADELCQL